MKKLTLYVITVLLMVSIIPTQLKAVTETAATSVPLNIPDESAKVEALLARLDEINAMDKSALNAPEKKELRKEVRAIKSELKEINKGVYLSVGAIIIIILLLILLL